MMPEVDGFALLEQIRGNSADKGPACDRLSARAGEEAKIEGLGAGADDYLVKPFSGRELLARVAANLSMSRVRIEMARKLRARTAELETVLKRSRPPCGLPMTTMPLMFGAQVKRCPASDAEQPS